MSQFVTETNDHSGHIVLFIHIFGTAFLSEQQTLLSTLEAFIILFPKIVMTGKK
jgi:hypothetical protein